MRILCTNDDGIHAPGLKVVEEIARALSDDVWIVAPELDQSGVSHSLSLNDPLRLREIGPRHFAVRGTPTDCIIMGARHILGKKLPDLVLSGVNKGRNVAEDVVYSGTIAGALEGTILGLPSFALSQEFSMETRDKPLWDTALKFGPQIVRKVIDAGVPKSTVINVNFPACTPDDVKGVLVTRQGTRNLGFLKVDQRRDGRGNPYFWIGFERAAMMDTPAEGTDLAALAAHYVSVTPLRLDRTDEAFSEALTQTLK
jgi:5'-nucleotidase